MKRFCSSVLIMFLLVMAVVANAAPVNGIYTSTDLGGQLFPGRASTWRPGINSGLPHVLHAQSWDGTSLGTQWEINCATENSAFNVQDNRVAGVGTVVYTSVFSGGTFTFFPGPWAWGNGTGTLGTTNLVTTVQFIMIAGNSTPVASVVNGNTSGAFSNGCALSFAIANGNGVGETTSLNVGILKPATYPVFYDGSCSPSSPSAQFGTWGDVRTITLQIDCAVPTTKSSWGGIKSYYR